MSYAELMITSNFTFLTGASHPEELVERAAELGLKALALTDTNSLAGVVRAHAAAQEAGLRFLPGACLALADGRRILALPKDRAGWRRLCRMLTVGKRRTVKGACELHLADVLDWGAGSVLIALPEEGARFGETLRALRTAFGDDVFAGLVPDYDGLDTERFERIAAVAEVAGVLPVALGNVLMHRAARRRMADLLSCIRLRKTIDRLGLEALPNAERRLKSPFEMRRLFARFPAAVAATLDIAERCRFCLSQLCYEYPEEVTGGQPPDDRLRALTEAGLAARYPDGVPLKVQALAQKELSLIRRLDYARYFLTVHDIVDFARGRGILCQGRGSAANSVVCYALGVTSVGPETISMVFERFVSEARNEPPDIDVDFEHERREEVIQHIYKKYGRHRAGLCATVIHFRARAAIRETGQAMGLSADIVAALASRVWGWSSGGVPDSYAVEAGLDLKDPRLRLALDLAGELTGFPRHLSQHVGGFVITKGRLDEFCPIENAAMADRTVIEWDKDDIDVLGMLKVDVLSLGMLTCIRKAFDLIASHEGTRYTLATLPPEDPAVYDMLCKGDSVGLFQVESRAQMNFLPRMRPRNFYDLVIEVAIVRPGPIQGDMVHPYLKRRNGQEKVIYPSAELEQVLKRTLGVPLFQEQAMQIAIVAAGFDAGEADQLRRSLGAFRGPGSVEKFRDRFIEGASAKGYDRDFAERCFRQLEGFSGYGFPESHAASFALLVYASAWLKCHHPAIYACAILNAQPMGFYAPAQLVRDAREHGVEVRPVSVQHSFQDNVLEPDGRGGWAVRLGFRQIKGFREEDGIFLAAARGNGYGAVADLWRRAGLAPAALVRLAEADAFAALGLTRREALWQARAVRGPAPLPLLAEIEGEEAQERPPPLPEMSAGEQVFEDYVSTRLSLRDHPLRLLRPRLSRQVVTTRNLAATPDGRYVSVAGLVITRQRPGTASGVIFITLEDESGVCNVIVWPKVFEKFRRQVMIGRLLTIRGKLQREGQIIHLISDDIEDSSWLLDQLGQMDGTARIDPAWGGADEARNPLPSSRGRPSRATPPPVPAPARHPREQAKKLFPSRDFH